MKQETTELRNSYIFLFWIPLASTWFMMGVEGPFLNAIIARLGDPKYNLAAYGVAYSLAILVEAPVIMLLSASTALVKDAHSYRKLFRFTFVLNVFVTIVMLLLAIPSLFSFIGEGLIGLPHKVSTLTHMCMVFLIPWPAAIGLRRFYQGILIINKRTRRVAYGTIIRLIAMSSTAALLFTLSSLPGAWVGAIALSMGVCVECIACRIMVHAILRQIQGQTESNTQPLTYKKIIKFYTPLAMTSFLSLGAHPIVTFFVGQSRMALESLAVLPVVSSFTFLFKSFGLSYQEVVIALAGDRYQQYRPIKRFALILGAILTVIYCGFVLTPLMSIWYGSVSGLTEELIRLAVPATLILISVPLWEVWLSVQRGSLVIGHKTTPVTIATVIELCGIIIILVLGVKVFDLIGAIAGVSALIIGRSCAIFYLFFPMNAVLSKLKSSPKI